MPLSEEQRRTRAVYEDPEVVAAFRAAHAATEPPPPVAAALQAFAAALPAPGDGSDGARVLDVGCGAGAHALYLARLGCRVTGIDYSEAMVREARDLAAAAGMSSSRSTLCFRALDMRRLADGYPPASFEGAWLSASLLHIPEAETPAVLAGLRHVLVPGGRARFALKGGPQGARLVSEVKYGKRIEREFVFWEAERFAALLTAHGFSVADFREKVGGVTGGEPTHWLLFDTLASPGR